jgi:hypothetical protein
MQGLITHAARIVQGDGPTPLLRHGFTQPTGVTLATFPLIVQAGSSTRNFGIFPALEGRACGSITGVNRMPRYFFDLVDDKTIFDKEGVSLPNVKEAERYAMTFARELIQTQKELLGESWQAWSVQVCNGKFDRILKIPFSQIEQSKS